MFKTFKNSITEKKGELKQRACWEERWRVHLEKGGREMGAVTTKPGKGSGLDEKKKKFKCWGKRQGKGNRQRGEKDCQLVSNR